MAKNNELAKNNVELKEQYEKLKGEIDEKYAMMQKQLEEKNENMKKFSDGGEGTEEIEI